MFLRRIVGLFLFTTSLCSVIGNGGFIFGQTVNGPATNSDASQSYQLPNTEVFDMISKEGREYRIFLAYPNGDPPPEGAPVLYVLDANAYFPLVTTLSRLSSRRSDYSPVIVGIGYPTDTSFDTQRRTFDLTTKANPEKLPPSRGGRGWPESGGADRFLGFIQNELKPRIAEKTSIDSDRQAIVGHSFGGLFVMHTLFTHPEAFQTYIAISPSGWWNDYALLAEEEEFSQQIKTTLKSPVRLLIQVGELELKGDAGPAGALKPTPAKDAFGSTADFAKRLSEIRSKQLTVRYREYEGKSHGSVVPPAMIDALEFAFPSGPRSAS